MLDSDLRGVGDEDVTALRRGVAPGPNFEYLFLCKRPPGPVGCDAAVPAVGRAAGAVSGGSAGCWEVELGVASAEWAS